MFNEGLRSHVRGLRRTRHQCFTDVVLEHLSSCVMRSRVATIHSGEMEGDNSSGSGVHFIINVVKPLLPIVREKESVAVFDEKELIGDQTPERRPDDSAFDG